ncbi:MAG TPA: response regulator [Spirochaetota bacterium]
MNSDKTILIVDDEKMIRETIADYFTDMGFHSRTAESGEKALAILRDEKFSYATVDLKMDGMTGEDFITQALMINNAMKFIIFTGSYNVMLPEELVRIGITENQIYQKPVRLSDIYQAIIDL